MALNFTFIDLFSGIGGFRIPLEQMGGICVGYSEINKEAISVYKKNFCTSKDVVFGDLTKIISLPPVDLIVGGVPCQPWSAAGLSKGFEDTRGKLWFDVVKLTKQSKPKAFVFENVPGLLNSNNKNSFDVILSELTKAGYVVKYKILNASDFGLPQNRERVFIVGIRNNIATNYVFPSPTNTTTRVWDVLESKVFAPEKNNQANNKNCNDFFIFSDLRNGETTIHSWDIIQSTKREKLICSIISKNRRRKIYGDKDGNPLSFENIKKLVYDLDVSELNNLIIKNILLKTPDNKYEFVNSKNIAGINNIYRITMPNAKTLPTLTATCENCYIATETIYSEDPEHRKQLFLDNIFKPKKYIPINGYHAQKLQGFPVVFIRHPKDSVAKKQFGNSVPVPVVEKVLIKLINILRN